jgi:hypothetical protein
MSASLLQLQSVGVQDLQLTVNPEINIFKYSYYRYVNFATETVKLQFNEIVDFGKKSVCDIQRRAHLLSKLYLHIRLPKLEHTSGSYLCWSDALGYAIFDGPIEFEVNGIIVDRIYPRLSEMLDELTNVGKELGKTQMMLKSDIYTASYDNAKNEVDLMIPLDFWFTKKYNMSLPLLSMFNQEIKIKFKLRQFGDIINYDGAIPAEKSIIESYLYAEYIYLDDVIAEKFLNDKHTFLIEQVQYGEDDLIAANTNIYNTKINFNHPVKELLFGCVHKSNIESNNYFAYGNNIDNTSIIKEASLLLDGKRRFEELNEFYYRCIFPDMLHSKIPMRYIYVMPFCLNPEDNQPTGTINMSRFNDITLSLKLKSEMPESYLYIYGISYNIITIEKGNFTVEWSS